MEALIYVKNRDGIPMMPTRRAGWVRRALKTKKAKVISSFPFTIQLTYKTKTDVRQPVIYGNDPGRTNLGAAAVRDDGTRLYASECVTRNKDIPDLMMRRKGFRQASRRGERLTRKRLAKRLGTTTKKLLRRILPGCERPLAVKDIINTEARFNNRKREAGWLTPTATQLLRTHVNLLRKVMDILPVTDVVLEVNRFAFMCLDSPGLKRSQIDFQHGPLYGKTGVHDAVSAMQEGRCLMCQDPIEHYHHIKPRKKGGSDTMGNLAGLCFSCHDKVHKNEEYSKKLEEKKKGMNKKYGALSVLNQIIPKLTEQLIEMFPDHVYVTNGWDTKKYREKHNVPKGHGLDAYCIACSILKDQKHVDIPVQIYQIQQYRRHDRANIKSQRERTYYLDRKMVAKNRKKRTDQKSDSLQEWYLKVKAEYGTAAAEKMRSRLTVKKSKRSYNRKDRVLPGAVFLYKGKRYVMRSQLTGGKYYRAYGCGDKNFPAKDCILVERNKGLVYVGIMLPNGRQACIS